MFTLWHKVNPVSSVVNSDSLNILSIGLTLFLK